MDATRKLIFVLLLGLGVLVLMSSFKIAKLLGNFNQRIGVTEVDPALINLDGQQDGFVDPPLDANAGESELDEVDQNGVRVWRQKIRETGVTQQFSAKGKVESHNGYSAVELPNAVKIRNETNVNNFKFLHELIRILGKNDGKLGKQLFEYLPSYIRESRSKVKRPSQISTHLEKKSDHVTLPKASNQGKIIVSPVLDVMEIFRKYNQENINANETVNLNSDDHRKPLLNNHGRNLSNHSEWPTNSNQGFAIGPVLTNILSIFKSKIKYRKQSLVMKPIFNKHLKVNISSYRQVPNYELYDMSNSDSSRSSEPLDNANHIFQFKNSTNERRHQTLEENNISERKIRNTRAVSIFTLVTFSNFACQGYSTGRYGQCKAYAECYLDSGYGDGPCANSFGVCCLYQISTCGSSISKNISYILNPGYPASYSTTINPCTYTINKCATDVCQIRLDFQSVSLVGPVRTSTATPTAGNCVTDFVSFSTTSGDSFGPICGLESSGSQHIYMDLGLESGDSLTVNFGINAGTPTSTANRFWVIRAMQIPCSKSYTAEAGCRMWLTGLTGYVQSFNFDNAITPQFVQGTYPVCVRYEEGYCHICWQATTQTNSFQTDKGSTAGANTVASCSASIARVFILDSNIGGDRGTGPTSDVYCGGQLNPSYVCSFSSNRLEVDFVAPLAANPAGASGDAQRGFQLFYRQMPCNS